MSERATSDTMQVQAISETIGVERLAPHDLVRRRGLVAGQVVAWPFIALTLTACAGACWALWHERPFFIGFTLALYGCTWFFANAYREAWRRAAYVRQLMAMLTVVLLLLALALIHYDDASARVVYERQTLVLRRARSWLFVTVGLNLGAIVLIVAHGLGLGHGNRFFVRASGQRVKYNVVRKVLAIARGRVHDLAQPREPEDEPKGDVTS